MLKSNKNGIYNTGLFKHLLHVKILCEVLLRADSHITCPAVPFLDDKKNICQIRQQA
jgi:hypothetical protein